MVSVTITSELPLFGCLLACKLSISSAEESEPPSCSQAIILRTTIRDLQISHNAPYLPPKILHNLCFSFLLGITAVPREIENYAYAKFWGANKVHYGRCASGVQLTFLGIFQMHCYCCSRDRNLETIIPLNNEQFSLVNTRLKL